jgi:putative FmdB family regulatory protein
MESSTRRLTSPVRQCLVETFVMPTYDYECSACGHTFDELQSFSDPPLTKCPKCKKKKLKRLFGGGGAILFKGSGFYETDYRRAGQSNGDGKAEKGEKSDGEPAKGESKSEAKTETASETKTESKPAPKSDGKGGGKKTK